MRTGIKLSLLLLFCCSGAGTAHANLITNGSFETGIYSPVNANSWVHVAAGDTNIDGWVAGGDGVDWHNTTEFQPLQFGDKAVDLNWSDGDAGSISQTFATTIGEWYDLSFWLTGPGTSLPNPRQVRINVAGVETIFSQASSPNLALVWGNKELQFQAIDVSTTLSFSTVVNSGYWGPVIDNVSVSVIPEPTTMLLLGTGLLGLAGFRRKLKRS